MFHAVIKRVLSKVANGEIDAKIPVTAYIGLRSQKYSICKFSNWRIPSG
jgi:hypothetical protein